MGARVCTNMQLLSVGLCLCLCLCLCLSTQVSHLLKEHNCTTHAKPKPKPKLGMGMLYSALPPSLSSLSFSLSSQVSHLLRELHYSFFLPFLGHPVASSPFFISPHMLFNNDKSQIYSYILDRGILHFGAGGSGLRVLFIV